MSRRKGPWWPRCAECGEQGFNPTVPFGPNVSNIVWLHHKCREIWDKRLEAVKMEKEGGAQATQSFPRGTADNVPPSRDFLGVRQGPKRPAMESAFMSKSSKICSDAGKPRADRAPANEVRMNSFERHNIDHLSPSSLNQYASAPALWVMERLLNRRSPVGAAATRGRAAEYGIDLGLTDQSLPVDTCVNEAVKRFDKEMVLNGDSRREAERGKLRGYVENGLKELRPYGVPTAAQERVEVTLEDVPVPIIGFIDWLYDRHGLIVDLKTTERLPSAISEPHGRQGALYAKAHGNYGMRFAYVKPVTGRDGRSSIVYEMSGDDVQRHIEALRQIAVRLGRFLALSSDPNELAGLLVPDYSSFWWSNTITRAHGADVYNF